MISFSFFLKKNVIFIFFNGERERERERERELGIISPCTFVKKKKKSEFWVGVSMSQSGLGLCPTQNQPNDIGFPARKPAANCKNQQIKLDQTQLASSQVG